MVINFIKYWVMTLNFELMSSRVYFELMSLWAHYAYEPDIDFLSLNNKFFSTNKKMLKKINVFLSNFEKLQKINYLPIDYQKITNHLIKNWKKGSKFSILFYMNGDNDN